MYDWTVGAIISGLGRGAASLRLRELSLCRGPRGALATEPARWEAPRLAAFFGKKKRFKAGRMPRPTRPPSIVALAFHYRRPTP